MDTEAGGVGSASCGASNSWSGAECRGSRTTDDFRSGEWAALRRGNRGAVEQDDAAACLRRLDTSGVGNIANATPSRASAPIQHVE